MSMLHLLTNAAYSNPFSTDTDMQYKFGHASWMVMVMDMVMQHGHRHGLAVWAWTCIIDMVTQLDR
jgi:hypothetical protein